MAENPNNRLQKFNGSKSAIRPESWIKLYDFENNSLKEDEKIKNLMYYLTDSALEWYADEIISNPAIKRWEVVKEKLIQRFGSYNANPIVSASHRRLKREESIENYFQDKIRLLNQTHLTKEEKINLLTDGLPNDWKDLIVAAQPTDATKWFHIAASIEQNRASIQFKPKNKIHLATKNNDNRKNVCPFWCPICSKKGIKIKHWVTDCEDYDPNYKKDGPNQNTSVKQVCGAPELLNVITLTNTPTQGAFKLINISVEVNGIPAQAFVDTGATVSIINWRLFKRTRLQLQPNSDIHISQADGVTRTCGSLQTKVRIDKLIKPVTLHVMKNFKYPLLIGLDVASLFNLLIDVRDKTIYTKIDGLQNPILVNHLEEIREHELKKLLEHNKNVFSQHAIDLGKVAIQHKIITKSEQPISLRPYRRPLKEYEEIAEQVKELLEHKLIRTSDSPWAFPVVMVPKKDGNKRMCIDYRRLNEITLDDRQPLPHIQDMFDRLHGSRFFSTLDVAWGYWQIEMDPQSIQKTAFVTNDGHYEFLVMPFGLKNAASTFQRIIQHILGELLWKGTCSFQDDILVYTKTWQEHIELLSKVFDKLRQYNMKLKLSKCIFGRTEVKYLGHIISHNQLKPDPGKVKSIQDFPRPDTVKKVRQFMGLANYYRKFVKDFSKISFPLVRLTRKNQPFIWNEEVEESFAKLKMALSTKPVLAIYNPDYPSRVYTDASKYGIGAILTQIGPDNEEHVIAYYSKTLQPHQENYSAYEMECLAVIQATDHFHVYIENQPFEIITDHAALQWLFTMKKPKPKYFRWILSLSSKSCNIVHRSGKQQTHVDALSRLPVVNIATQELQEHQQNSDLSFLKNSHTHDGVVMIKQKGVFKAVVPNSLTKKILEEYHDSLSHPSITKTCKLITQCYWWKGITTDIKNYVRSCKSCQLVKVRHEPTLGEMITPTSNIQPLQMIGCDTIVLGTAAANTKHKFIQVFVDHATRYLWAYPTITNTAQAVTQCLDKIIKSVNSINTILTDNGKNFISKEFNKFLSSQGIKHTYTSPYHPQCNGICEKLNDTIMTKLRIAVLEKPRCKWSSLLPQVVKNYNSTPHDVTGFSPLFLMYGIGNVPEFADQTPITIEEARKKASLRTEQFRSKWKIKHDSHHPKYVFKEGDLVIRKIAFNDPCLIKTSPKYEGPFVIQKKISDVTYDISLKDQKQARRSNGLAERAVKMIKMALDKNKIKPGDTIHDTISKMLLAYGSTPHETTKKTPSELFIGSSLRTRLSIIHPNLESRVKEQQARQMKYDHGFQQDEFGIDAMVWCRNFRGGDRWIPGRIVRRKGSRVYTVLIHGQVKSYHRDQIRKRWENGGDEDRQYGRQREKTDIIVPEADMPNRGRSESLPIETARQQRDSGLVDQNDGGISRESSRSPDPEAKKSALANKLNLEKTLLLEALTDGMPDHLKKYLIAARVQEPSEWYKITTQLKLSTNKEEEPQQPSTSTSTPVKKFNSNSSKAHQYQPFPRTAAATHHQQEPHKSINQPPYPCKICASHQLPNQIHFHRDCPLKNNNHPKRINPGFTPKFLYYGIQPQYIEHDTVTHTPIEKARKLAIERTIKSHEHSKQLYDIKHPEPIFKEGDQ
ncbi:K02A2.6-like, partial [Cordylochernes scorpioides]